ncbi:MAG: hypothetical protein JWO59_2593 [Chloroflexi bacterium]|nr:hypothetical protein [Chloroflexota bacterium]
MNSADSPFDAPTIPALGIAANQLVILSGLRAQFP